MRKTALQFPKTIKLTNYLISFAWTSNTFTPSRRTQCKRKAPSKIIQRSKLLKRSRIAILRLPLALTTDMKNSKWDHALQRQPIINSKSEQHTLFDRRIPLSSFTNKLVPQAANRKRFLTISTLIDRAVVRQLYRRIPVQTITFALEPAKTTRACSSGSV